MKANELRDKTPDQLREELVNLKKESFNLRFQQATGQLENTARCATRPSRCGPREDDFQPESGQPPPSRRPEECPSVSCRAS